MRKLRKSLLIVLAGVVCLTTINPPRDSNIFLSEIYSQTEKVYHEIKYEKEKGRHDVWQPPEVTKRLRYGDCEDKAILLRENLRKLGISVELVIGKSNPKTDEYRHAWLEVDSPKGELPVRYILEATNGKIYSRDEATKKGAYVIQTHEKELRKKGFSRRVEELNKCAGRKIL